MITCIKCEKPITKGSKSGMCRSCSKKGKMPTNLEWLIYNAKTNHPRKGKSAPWNKNLPQCFKRGYMPWNKGLKGVMPSGENHAMFGKHHSEKSCLKISIANQGKDAWNRGKPSKIFGEKAWNWKGGISPLKSILKNGIYWKLWREKVYKRDIILVYYAVIMKVEILMVIIFLHLFLLFLKNLF